jgi:hypothetical protein
LPGSRAGDASALINTLLQHLSLPTSFSQLHEFSFFGPKNGPEMAAIRMLARKEASSRASIEAPRQFARIAAKARRQTIRVQAPEMQRLTQSVVLNELGKRCVQCQELKQGVNESVRRLLNWHWMSLCFMLNLDCSSCLNHCQPRIETYRECVHRLFTDLFTT